MAANKYPKCGTGHYLSKLEKNDIRLIRELAGERERLIREAKSLTNQKIAEKFEVHEHTIWRVLNFASYKDCA